MGRTNVSSDCVYQLGHSQPGLPSVIVIFSGGAPYGFKVYSLNVMAGPLRKWRFVPAPEVEHLF